MEARMRFSERIVIVTGGGKGIGRAISLGFAREGAHVVIGYNSDKRAAEETAESVRSSGVESLVLKVDVTRKEDCEALVNEAVDRFGRIDVAVNNAGVSTMSWVVDMTEEEWDFNMDVNAKGVFLGCQAQTRRFVQQGEGGRIVIVASIASKRPVPLLAHYAASKYAVLGFAKSLAMEVATHGITVNCVCPGLVKTSMQEREIGWEAKHKGVTEEQIKREYIESVPLGRLEEPEDVAKVVLFLASDDASYMTGQALNVAGGMEMVM
jgi:meso-butanediol dehydrogenase/(S,S)-butanediol dehydrogenase/diacetyl reductase